jgi:hypothetical protein
MKKIRKKMLSIFVIVFFIFLVFLTESWSQEKIEAPVLNVGDKWTYKNADGTIYADEVVGVRDDVFILKLGDDKYMYKDYLHAYDRKTMNLKSWIDAYGKEVRADVFTRNLLDFPIFVGKKWGDGATYWFVDFKVESIEEVITPAGTFKAYKIYCRVESKRTGGGAAGVGWIRFWYSPQVKKVVKRVYEKSRYWSGYISNQDAELISYELK